MSGMVFSVVCLFFGVCAGFLGGLLGVGGGVIVVPALLYLFHATEVLPVDDTALSTTTIAAIATSMGTIVFTTGASSVAQIRRHAVDWLVFRRWAVFLMIGSFAASFVARLLDVRSLEIFISVFLLCVAVLLLTGWQPKSARRWPAPSASAAIAGVGGLISGLAGIGGGNVVVPTLLYFNFTMARAVATATVLGFCVACCGTAGYIITGWSVDLPRSIGYVYLPAAIPIACASMVFAPLGVSLSHRLSSTVLRQLFGALIVIVAIRITLASLMRSA